jgi:hypothetical protein
MLGSAASASMQPGRAPRPDGVGEGPQPDGQPVELDLQRDLPATADALRQASLRGEAERARLAERRAAARP